MRFPAPLVPGRLLRRYQRFLADVRLDGGETVVAHCANPGSMKGLIAPGARVLLSVSDDPKRKLRHSWELVRVGRHWACVNTARPNQVVAEALAKGRVPELRGYDTIRPEAPMGERRRVDFRLDGPAGRCFVEVKSVTLADGTLARFPDSVTARGTAHLEELIERRRAGDRAVMLYVVNRGDCDRCAPAADIDPVYAETLARAVAAGVETLAWRSRVGPAGVTLSHPVPFLLE